ncbi:helix-turn-helix domain-containing protein [Peribacillus frigoritolerans]|uniref:helix-turn-helix domain-containing protein n=1 Tax=Peribacillus frigoritolerans TaxID=450367 RepID=UPI0020A1F077|nr:helix-turn-helix domain-containing protein [Peribacillus frigoritolerans]
MHNLKVFGLEPKLNELFCAIPDESVLTPNQIAALLVRSEETIRRWCRKGKLPAYNWGGKYVIMGSDFKEFMIASRNNHENAQRFLL